MLNPAETGEEKKDPVSTSALARVTIWEPTPFVWKLLLALLLFALPIAFVAFMSYAISSRSNLPPSGTAAR
jgi:hypothetical protein